MYYLEMFNKCFSMHPLYCILLIVVLLFFFSVLVRGWPEDIINPILDLIEKYRGDGDGDDDDGIVGKYKIKMENPEISFEGKDEVRIQRLNIEIERRD